MDGTDLVPGYGYPEEQEDLLNRTGIVARGADVFARTAAMGRGETGRRRAPA